MIIKIQTKQSKLCWNSAKCKPLQVLKSIIVLSIPFFAAILGGMVEVMM